ncbi:MAG: hypothetical protein PUC00_06745 [Clostridiales bacterium]|nr:hypothetical protein [Clostridiales bacterium]
MKRILSLTLGCLLFCALTASALANEWGLRGGVYDIVADNKRFDGYTAIADDGNTKLSSGIHVNQAILENRYHALLVCAARYDRVWEANAMVTTAVYQPGDKRGAYPANPTLEHLDGNCFRLSYGQEEAYIFQWDEEAYVLVEARYDISSGNSDSFIMDERGLSFWQANPGDAFLPVGDALWPTTITLEEFNIAQMPRTLAEMRCLNMTAVALMEAEALSATDLWSPVQGEGMLPVYSAPDQSSFRAANDKASVSLQDEVTIYGTVDGWTLIGYEVSPRTSRIGYVHRELGGEPLALGSFPLRAAVNTFLTDDPFVSQYPQVNIPTGATLTGLAQCGEYYAYVAYEAEGLQYRGFVPMKDLMPVYDRALATGSDRLTADVRWDVMDALCGKWCDAFGSWEDRLVLYTSGSFVQWQDGAVRDVGNYRVYDGENGTFSLYMATEDNQEAVYTLTLNVDGTITLTDERGNTPYRRMEYSSLGNG